MKKGWIDGETKPKKNRWFDLFRLDLGHKVIQGWWDGKDWEGAHYKGEKVLRWMSIYE